MECAALVKVSDKVQSVKSLLLSQKEAMIAMEGECVVSTWSSTWNICWHSAEPPVLPFLIIKGGDNQETAQKLLFNLPLIFVNTN